MMYILLCKKKQNQKISKNKRKRQTRQSIHKIYGRKINSIQGTFVLIIMSVHHILNNFVLQLGKFLC